VYDAFANASDEAMLAAKLNAHDKTSV